MADKIKMFADPLYIIGKGCITVGNKTYNAKTGPVPSGKVAEQDADAMLKSGMAAKVQSKENIADMESAAQKKVKGLTKTVSEQHDEIEKLNLSLKSLPAMKKKAESSTELEKDIAKLEKEAELKEVASDKEVGDLKKTHLEELKVKDETIANLKKDVEDLKKLAGGPK